MGLGLELKSTFRSLFDKRTPIKFKIITIFSVLYSFSPIDLIPDVIAFFGIADDGILITSTIFVLRYKLPELVFTEYKEKYASDKGIGFGKIILLILGSWLIVLIGIWFTLFG